MIANIRLQQFRSYIDSSFEFDEKTNIIVGPNASGKTNLLEAISVVTRGKSFRAKDTDLIAHDYTWARLDAFVNNKPKTVKLYSDRVANKEFVVNNKTYKRLTKDFVYPVVLFEPNDLTMLYGSPDSRRAYLDNIIDYRHLSHLNTLKLYARSIAQRNRLLKQHRTPDESLFVWDLRLSQLAEKITNARLSMLDTINQSIPEVYSKIAGKEQILELRLKSNCDIKQYGTSMLHKLESNKQLDIDRGFTSVGPHRDDIDIMLNDIIANQTASRGEFRTILLALKVIELQTLESITKEPPILLLDDVFSELDGKRRHHLTEFIKNYQSFITTTDADIVAKNFTKKTNLIALGSTG